MDRSEEINRYRRSMNLSPIDIPERNVPAKENVLFDPSKLDFDCPEKVMTRAVVKVL